MKYRPVLESELAEFVDTLWTGFATEVASYSDGSEDADELASDALEHRRQHYQNDDTHTIVAIDKGDLVGYASGRLQPRASMLGGGTEFLISEVYVLPEYRNQHVATRLLDRLEEWGEEQGCEVIALNVDCENTVARDVYRERGYKPSRIRMTLH